MKSKSEMGVGGTRTMFEGGLQMQRGLAAADKKQLREAASDTAASRSNTQCEKERQGQEAGKASRGRWRGTGEHSRRR
jgi:hypothetical protein